MFKRIALLALSAMLILATSASCSKDKDTRSDDKKSARAKTAAERTVDLGENDDASDASDKEEKKFQPKEKVTRGPAGDRPTRGPKEKFSAEEIAKKNDEASKNPDGSAKRGKPAAQLDAEEAAKAKNEVADEKPQPDAAESDAMADNAAPAEDTDAMNFVDDEVEEELTPRIVQKRKGLNVDNLVSIKELREQTGYSGALIQTDLVGQESDNRYNVIRLSTDKTSELGFTVQVWKPGNESAASKRFEDLFKQSFGGEKQKDIANDAFLASHHNISELAFFDKRKSAVVMISCSHSVCKKEQLKDIALSIQRKL